MRKVEVRDNSNCIGKDRDAAHFGWYLRYKLNNYVPVNVRNSSGSYNYLIIMKFDEKMKCYNFLSIAKNPDKSKSKKRIFLYMKKVGRECKVYKCVIRFTCEQSFWKIYNRKSEHCKRGKERKKLKSEKIMLLNRVKNGKNVRNCQINVKV